MGGCGRQGKEQGKPGANSPAMLRRRISVQGQFGGTNGGGERTQEAARVRQVRKGLTFGMYWNPCNVPENKSFLHGIHAQFHHRFKRAESVFGIRRIEKTGRELAHILSSRIVCDQVYMPWGQDFTIRFLSISTSFSMFVARRHVRP